VTSGFRRDADQICALLRYNAASTGNPLPAFWDNVSAASSRVKKSKKKGLLDPQNRNFKNTNFLVIMITRLYVIYPSAKISH
jgi:hypothetical protein